MNRRRPRTLAALCLAFLATFAGVVVWLSGSRSSALRLTFLCSTNHPMLGTVGVFEFVNGLNEPVRIGNSFYKSAYRPGTTPKIGDFGARPLVADPTAPFAACSTNVFLMWAPTNGGAYRAVMYCPLEYSDHEAPFAQSQPFAIGR